ncbi:MAG: hypothetical protein ACR2OO_00525 [Thermomicrobiales bacterium]
MTAAALARSARRALATLLIGAVTLAPVPAPRPVAAAESVSVTIHAYSCAEGFDGAGLGFADLAAACATPTTGLQFTLTDSTGASTSQFTTAVVSDGVGFQGVPAGLTTAAEGLPDGVTVRAFCAVSNPGAGTAGGYAEKETGAGTAGWDLQPGESLDCDWYNFRPAEARASVVVYASGCPASARDGSLDQLIDSCPTSLTGVGFALTPSGGQGGGAAQTDASGAVRWDRQGAGQYALSETMPDGYAASRVFCGAYPNGQDDSVGIAVAEVGVAGDGSIAYRLDQGLSLKCNWFNIAKAATASFALSLTGCPDGFDGIGATIDAYIACRENLTGIPVSLSLDGAVPMAETTDVGGTAVWRDIQAGQVAVTAAIPAAYDRIHVFCGTVDRAHPDLSQVVPVEVPIIGGNGISRELAAESVEYCHWYAFPVAKPTPTPSPTPTPPALGAPTAAATEPASLTIVLHVCNADCDPFDAGADPAKDCAKSADGVPFTMIGRRGVQTRRVTGDDGKGTVRFGKLDPGSFVLREDGTAGPGNAFAFLAGCTSDRRPSVGAPLFPYAFAGPAGEVALMVEAGEQLTCSWYDVPPKPLPMATVRIAVQRCPGRTANPASCVADPGGGSLTLSPVGGSGKAITQTSGKDGVATFAVPPGAYALSEPPGVDLCFADSKAFDAEDHLVVTADAPVDVTIYTCGPKP